MRFFGLRVYVQYEGLIIDSLYYARHEVEGLLLWAVLIPVIHPSSIPIGPIWVVGKLE